MSGGTLSGCKLINSLTGGLRSARPPAIIFQPFGLTHLLLSFERANTRLGESSMSPPSPKGEGVLREPQKLLLHKIISKNPKKPDRHAIDYRRFETRAFGGVNRGRSQRLRTKHGFR